MNGEACCRCYTTAPPTTTQPPTTTYSYCVDENGEKQKLPYEKNCNCPNGYTVDPSHMIMNGGPCCKCISTPKPTTTPAPTTTVQYCVATDIYGTVIQRPIPAKCTRVKECLDSQVLLPTPKVQ